MTGFVLQGHIYSSLHNADCFKAAHKFSVSCKAALLKKKHNSVYFLFLSDSVSAVKYYTDLNPSPDRIKHPTVFYFFTELG